MATLADLQQQAADAQKKYDSFVALITSNYSSMSTVFNSVGSCYNKGSNNTLEAQLTFGQMNLKSCCDHFTHSNQVVSACKASVNSFNKYYNDWLSAKNNAATAKNILDSANNAVKNFIETDPGTITDSKNRITRNFVIISVVLLIIIVSIVMLYKKYSK